MMQFAEFFHAVHGCEPFPWQQMLAERVLKTGIWPAVIDLPTASGKTAVMDIAVWHLAQQADLPPAQRTAPRRIWFVVDRRIVVDEAYQRAAKIAHWLWENRYSDIASALYEVSGLSEQRKGVPPLSYGRLRGGILQDNGWASFPSQPAILTSTVDQFGSRLLFRGYGMGPGMWPIHAALAGNDSLLVLDEAHLARPLIQTLEWFQRYRGKDWCEQPIDLPWQMTRMSATPSPNETDRFPMPDQRAVALDHPMLRLRTHASKRARLVPVTSPKATTKRPATACAPEAVECVEQFVADGRRRIAVMMNRVDAAIAVYEKLKECEDLDIDLVLLTGRMRPFDRDRFVNEWYPAKVEPQGDGKGLTHWLGARSDPPALDRPIVLVTTQCLEVGADLSFDALVTECASLDALRQRFGRLNRLGLSAWNPAPAAILAWHGDIDGSRTDPIYGDALRKTWDWLNVHAENDVIDLGITPLQEKLNDADIEGMLPPRPDAPVLLPAYLDVWCQTGPRPHVEAAPALFLHGKGEQQPDVQIAFRRDLTDELNDEQWAQIVQLTPPASDELLTVRLHRLRQWLTGEKTVAADSDVEGVVVDGEQKSTEPPPSRWVNYRGQGDQTRTQRDVRDIDPGDILILPGGDHIPRVLGHGEEPGCVDIHEQAVARSGRPQTFRLSRQALDTWLEEPSEAVEPSNVDLLHAWLKTEDGALPDMDEWQEVQEVLRRIVPDHLRNALNELGRKPQIARYPIQGDFVLIGSPRKAEQQEIDPFADDEDSYSLIGEAVPLDAHSEYVAKLTRRFADCCTPAFADVLERAAELHDAGKREPRFQALLHGQPVPWVDGELLAKSEGRPSPMDRVLRQKLGIVGFRHEMLSMQRAAEEDDADDLLLHLIASHHGHARPFAPVPCNDLGIWNDPPPHHVGSGVAERFWKLTRRYGWWGLAYLEALLRLADHHASRFPRTVSSEADDD